MASQSFEIAQAALVAETCELLLSARSLFLFGSRACNCHQLQSDTDFLAIGNGSRFKSKSIDVVWVSEAEMASSDWLGGELACHVAKYGLCLWGDSDCISDAFVSERSVSLKIQRIRGRLRVYSTVFQGLSARRKKAYIRKVRLDLQRLYLMEEGKAVPPTSMLEQVWREYSLDTKADFLRRFSSIESRCPVGEILDLSL